MNLFPLSPGSFVWPPAGRTTPGLMYVLRLLISRDESVLTCLMSFFPQGGG